MTLKISIVTPSYNQAAFLKEAIASVRQQKYPVCEHIVLDNCSLDGTQDILSGARDVMSVIEEDQGQSHALNKGFRIATGDIVGWLNADDRYLPGCFRKVEEFFGTHPHVDVLYGDYRVIDAAGRVLRVKREFAFDLFTLKYHHVLCIPSTTCFFRRRIFDEGNFLDERYHYAMDYEFFLRLALKGYSFVHIPELMADFRWHADAKSSRQAECQRREREQALLWHDRGLRGVVPLCRPLWRGLLMFLSRSRRFFLRLFL